MADVMKMVVGKRMTNPLVKDSDKDGIMNMLDCQPHNPREQGLIHKIGAGLARKVGREEIAESIEKRGEQRDKDRAEVREAGREAFQKERVIVARKRGIARARGGTSFGSFISGIRSSSPIGLPRVGTTTGTGKRGRKITRYVKVKGKPGQFRKVTSKAKGMRTASQPKTIRDVLGGNMPKFF